MTHLNDILLSYLQIGLVSGAMMLLLYLFSAFLMNRYGARWIGKLLVILALIMLIPFSLLLEPIPLPRLQISPDQLYSPTPAKEYSITVHPNTQGNPLMEGSSPKEDAADSNGFAKLDKDAYEVRYPAANQYTESMKAPTAVWYKNPNILLSIWLIGIALIFAYQIAFYLVWRKRIIQACQRVTEPKLLSCFLHAQLAARYYKEIPLYITGKINTPMTAGILHPVILLPDASYDDINLQYILTHELTHLKRHDPWRKLLYMSVTAIHWMNPIVWMMRSFAHHILELACDESMVSGKPDEYRQRYGQTLLHEIKRSNCPNTVLVNCFVNEKKNIMNRLRVILKQRSHKRGFALISILLTLCIIGSSLFGCEEISQTDINQTNDSLTIYYYQQWNDTIAQRLVDHAIELFEEQHPGIKVEFYDPSGGDPDMSVEMISKKLQTDFMAGKGPDVILDTLFLNLDLYKMVSNNMIADLKPFMEKDSTFDNSMFYENILQSYQYKGKQYAMPIYWNDIWYATTRENLERNGFSVDALHSFSSFIDELYRVMQEGGSRYSTIDGDSIFYWNQEAAQIDFDRRTLHLLDLSNPSNIADPLVRKVIEVNQLIQETEKAYPIPQEFNMREVIINGKKILQSTFNNNYDVASVMKEHRVLFTLLTQRTSQKLIESGEELILVPCLMTDDNLYWNNGLYAFLMENSPNKQNGYDLISLLIGQETQETGLFPRSDPTEAPFFNPIRRGYEEAMVKGLSVTDENEIPKFIEMLSSPGYDASYPLFVNSYTILEDIMRPFLDGEKSFEECAAQAEDYFSIYFSE